MFTNDKIEKGNEPLLVLFYMPNCKFCKNPALIDLVDKIKKGELKDKIPYKLYTIDITRKDLDKSLIKYIIGVVPDLAFIPCGHNSASTIVYHHDSKLWTVEAVAGFLERHSDTIKDCKSIKEIVKDLKALMKRGREMNDKVNTKSFEISEGESVGTITGSIVTMLPVKHGVRYGMAYKHNANILAIMNPKDAAILVTNRDFKDLKFSYKVVKLTNQEMGIGVGANVHNLKVGVDKVRMYRVTKDGYLIALICEFV